MTLSDKIVERELKKRSADDWIEHISRIQAPRERRALYALVWFAYMAERHDGAKIRLLADLPVSDEKPLTGEELREALLQVGFSHGIADQRARIADEYFELDRDKQFTQDNGRKRGYE